jgi:hypothetical protein
MHHRWKKIIDFVCKTTNGNHKGQTPYKGPIELKGNSNLACFGNSTYHHSQVPMHTRSRPKKLEYCQTGHKKTKKPQEKVSVRD